MNPTILSIMSAMAAAAWSVWTWQSEQEKVRELKRNEMSAQYVNNFIVATQEVQRKLYRILEEDELAQYRLKYPQPIEPASPVALDILFHLSTFFGWEILTFRFGPYTRDAKMIAMMAEIAEVLDSRSLFPGDAFRFSLSDRHALGQAVVKRVGETSSGPAFVNITRFKFEEEMLDEKSEYSALFRCDEIRSTLTAIDRAVRGEPLEGRERLAALQNILVDLLTYLEQKEGFRTSFGARRKAKTADRYSDIAASSKEVRILHQIPGRIRVRIPRLHTDRTFASRLHSRLQAVNHVQNVRINSEAASLVVEYSLDVPSAHMTKTVIATVEND